MKNGIKLSHSPKQLADEQSKVERLRQELEKGLRDLKAREKSIIQETRDRVVTEASELAAGAQTASTELRKQKSRETIENTRKSPGKYP